ncbi:hypothetical protein HYY69_05015 [Candidatus Woesearchaeota archaeon]|nr:hypothetical protein [Candidatus Woesearchaeota archaeon]
MRGSFAEDGTFVVGDHRDQSKGELLCNEYVSDTGFVTTAYGVEPTTRWKRGLKLAPSFVLEVPQHADDTVVTDPFLAKSPEVRVYAGDYVVLDVKKGKVFSVHGCKRTWLEETFVDYAKHMQNLTGTDSSPEKLYLSTALLLDAGDDHPGDRGRTRVMLLTDQINANLVLEQVGFGQELDLKQRYMTGELRTENRGNYFGEIASAMFQGARELPGFSGHEVNPLETTGQLYRIVSGSPTSLIPSSDLKLNEIG